MIIKYPQGAEKNLIDAILRREVPSGTLPFEVGALVQNVGTACAIYDAAAGGMPPIERVVTVTGRVKDRVGIVGERSTDNVSRTW